MYTRPVAPPPISGPQVTTWEPGTTVGRFTLVTTLAQGGMAEIWLARQTGLKGFAKLMVIKRMINALQDDPDSVEMFLTEARLAAQLAHPHVVQISELGEQGGSLYIVMEYLDGEDLAVVRRTGQKHGLPLLDHYSTRLVAMAAEGLHYAHTLVGLDGKPLRIVHRDVSPQNLIVTFDGSVKVVDFGIAKPSSQHTNSGKLKGKLAYMSPEQARGEPLDARSDVFSLGIVLFELVARTRLLPKMNDLELLTFMGGTQDLPKPSERRADIPEGLEAIIVKAMQRRKEDRFQSARELQEALEEWMRKAGKSPSSGELADYLRTLFAKRIHERRQLIEAALSADLTPSSAAHLQRLAQGEGSSSRSRTRATGSRSRGLVAGVVALSLVVGGLGVAVAKRASAAEETPVVVDAPAKGTATARPPAVPPAPKPSSLVIDSMPRGATLVVDGVERGVAPVTLDKVDKGEHQIEAKLEGYSPATRTVNVEREGDRLMVEVALLALPAPGPTDPPKTDPKKVKTPTRPAVAAAGKLTLKTTPWTQVYLGKKKLGDTPLVEVPLPAGRHTLRLVSPETNTESSIEVEILANETTVKKLKL